jgi:hypothetical protein
MLPDVSCVRGLKKHCLERRLLGIKKSAGIFYELIDAGGVIYGVYAEVHMPRW